MSTKTWSYDQRVHTPPYGGNTNFLARSVTITTGSIAPFVTSLVTAPDGQVALIDKLILAAAGDHVTPPVTDYLVLTLTDEDGTVQSRMPLFLGGFAATAVASPLGTQISSFQPVVWEPQAPLIVPSGWTLKVHQMDLGGGGTPSTPGTTTTHGTMQVQVYGIVVSEDDARGAGYDVSNSSTDASRNWIQTGTFMEQFSPSTGDPQGTNASTQFVPARTGNCVLITDLLVRLAPQTPTGNGGISLRQTDGTVIFEWYNSRIAEPITRIIRPRIYTEPGVGLEVHCIGSPSEDTSSVILLGRYVPVELVPKDAFWGCVQPPFPSAGLTSPDDASTAITLNYRNVSPGGSFDTATSPGMGSSHYLEGYEISVQKTAGETDTSAVLYALGTGANPGTGLVSGATALPITGIHAIVNEGENQTYGADKLWVECQANNGQILVDVDINSLLYPSPGGDAGLENWSFTVWGRTMEARHRFTSGDPTHLKGSN